MKADIEADIEASEPVLMSMALEADECMDFEEEHFEKLEERMKHMTDTYSEYLLYLIQSKGMENAEVWKRAIIDKKIFSKIKNNPDYHPQKMTALCLCIGAKLNLDESEIYWPGQVMHYHLVIRPILFFRILLKMKYMT